MSRPSLSQTHRLAMAVTAALITGCVTINIYFPAAAAEKAADRIIDEVWQIPAGPNDPSTNAASSKESR